MLEQSGDAFAGHLSCAAWTDSGDLNVQATNCSDRRAGLDDCVCRQLESSRAVFILPPEAVCFEDSGYQDNDNH